MISRDLNSTLKMAEKKEEEEIGEEWVICPAGDAGRQDISNEVINIGIAPKKRRGYSFWRYLGWGGSSSSRADNLPNLADYTTTKVASVHGGDDTLPSAIIHDPEMMTSLQNVANPLPADSATTTQDVDRVSETENNRPVLDDTIYPVDTIRTDDEVYAYLDNVIASLKKQETLQSTASEDCHPAPSNTNIREQDAAELLVYLEQLATTFKENEKEQDEYSDMPSLISSSSEDYTTPARLNNTEEIFGESLIPEVRKNEGSKENFERLEFDINDYFSSDKNSQITKEQGAELTEIVVESPQSPIFSEGGNTSVRRRRRPLRRPQTPYAKRNENNKEESTDDDAEMPAKRCKMDNDDDEFTLEVSDHTSEILVRMERGEALPEADRLFNTVRVVRRPAATENKFQHLLDRLCPSDFSDDSTTEDQSPIQAICEEFAELADSVTKFFRRGCGP
jgi:hypothetical protein